jgi:hypothetical protein
MKIILTPEQQKNAVLDKDLVIEGIEYKFIEKQKEMDENGIYYDVYFQKPGTEEFYRVSGFVCKYGYEDYDWEDSSNTLYLFAEEVVRKDVIITQWETK